MNFEHFGRVQALEVLTRSVVLHQSEDAAQTVYAIVHGGEDMVLVIDRVSGLGLLVDGNDTAYGGSVHDHARTAAASGTIAAPVAGRAVVAGRHGPRVAIARSNLDALDQATMDELNKVHAVELDTYCSELARSKVVDTLNYGGSVVHYGIRDDGQPIVFAQCSASDMNLIILPATTA